MILQPDIDLPTLPGDLERHLPAPKHVTLHLIPPFELRQFQPSACGQRSQVRWAVFNLNAGHSTKRVATTHQRNKINLFWQWGWWGGVCANHLERMLVKIRNQFYQAFSFSDYWSDVTECRWASWTASYHQDTESCYKTIWHPSWPARSLPSL